MNKITLNTLILAVFIYYDTKNILFMLIGFSIACILGYWKCRILPTKKDMIFLVYAVILGLLLKLIF